MRQLNRFLTTIPRTKAKVTSALLRQRQEEGEISTLAEYKDHLRGFTERINTTDPTTFYQFYDGAYHDEIRGPRHNRMLTLARADLETLFTELDHMLTMVDAHEDIFQRQAITELSYLLDLIEDKINMFEFLAGNEFGFSFSQWNTFSDGSRELPRESEFGWELASDFRTGARVPNGMTHDPLEQAMLLEVAKNSVERFTSVDVKDGIVDEHGQVAIWVEGEQMVAYQRSGNLWVFTVALGRSISRDAELHINVNPTSPIVFDTELNNAFPSVAGEYLIVYDADRRSDLAALGLANTNIGEIYFWNPVLPLTCSVDAILYDLPVALVVDAVLSPKYIAAGQATIPVGADAVLVNTQVTASADAILFFGPCKDIGTIDYAYTQAPRAYHKPDLRGDPIVSDINNILDNTKDTFWFNLILKDRQIVGGVRSSLKLNFGGVREINYVEIHPVTKYPFFIDQISYISRQDNKIALVDLHPAKITAPARFYFDPVSAKSIVLDICQENFELHTYDLNAAKDLTAWLDEFGDPSDPDIFRKAVEQTMNHSKIVEILGLDTATNPDLRTVYEYVYGLDNVLAGKLDLKSEGIYVGEGTDPAKVSLIGFEATTTVPAGKKASFEFELTKKDYDVGGALIGSARFPVLPIGVTSVVHERLIPNDDDVARTIFRAHGASPDNADATLRRTFCNLRVYRNGTLLDYGGPGGWLLDNNLVADDLDRFSGIILSIDQNIPEQKNGIYTASYTPLYTTVGDRRDYWADTAQTLRRNPDGTIEASLQRGNLAIEEAVLYLTATQRINQPNDTTVVAELNAYKIHVGEKKVTRFAAL